MAEKFKCSGNCLNCMPAQRAYCASQHAYSNMKVLDTMMETLLVMKGDLSEMKEKIEAIQNSEVFDPNDEDVSVESLHTLKTQSGDGVESRDPETK